MYVYVCNTHYNETTGVYSNIARVDLSSVPVRDHRRHSDVGTNHPTNSGVRHS